MAVCYLKLRFTDDGDGTGLLMARAESDGFAGEGEAYFNTSKIKDFAAAIAVFPLPENDARRSISSGFGAPSEQEHLGISVYAADRQRGYIGVQVRMATKVWPDTRPMSRKAATIEVVTTYEPLARFSRDLIAMLRGELEEATLTCEEYSG
jgi:hypothetical protein